MSSIKFFFLVENTFKGLDVSISYSFYKETALWTYIQHQVKMKSLPKFRYIAIIMCCFELMCCIAEYRKWTDVKEFQKPLWCPDYCYEKYPKDVSHCCRCQSKASWELPDNNEIGDSLQLLYYDKRGYAQLWNMQQKGRENASYSFLEYRYERLRKLPRNLCDFVSIVKLDLRGNKISQIVNMQCLTKLDNLDLSENNIIHVSNETFKNLSQLRLLDLSRNNIKILDPNSFSHQSIEISRINFAYNDLKSLDGTNIFLENRYCVINYTNSVHGTSTNLLNLQLSETKIYGSGLMLFENCDFSTNPYSALLGNDHKLYSKVFKYLNADCYFDFGGTTVDCDCSIEPIVEYATQKDYLHFFAGTYKCGKPEHLSGIGYHEIVNDTSILDSFICEKKENCPSVCKCVEQPSQRRMTINCTEGSLTSLPENLPKSDYNYELYFSNNDIKTVEDRDYFSNVTVIDLTNNSITRIDFDVFYKLKENLKIFKANTLNMENIPKSIQILPFDLNISVKISIACNCENLWLAEWSKFRNLDNVHCKNFQGKNLLSNDVSSELSICLQGSDLLKYLIIFLSLLLFVILAFSFLWRTFYFEILQIFISLRNVIHRIICNRTSKTNFSQDIYISLDENDEESRPIIVRNFIKKLAGTGYSIYTPCIHASPGEEKEIAVNQNLHSSRCILIILTKDYSSNPDCMVEFKLAWNIYLQDASRCLLLIKFDKLSHSKVKSRKILSFLRLRKYINVSNREINIYEAIQKRIGKPNNAFELENIGNNTPSCVRRNIHDLKI